jgi:A/G-specific adenine glycosylase
MEEHWSSIYKQLIEWWQSNGRDYPWRHSRNLYEVLVAEVLLHRTKADTVALYYGRFLKMYPDPDSLSRADSGLIERVFGSLGLTWRLEYMRDMAREIMLSYGGSVPSEKEALESLPGIGDYISSAVMVFIHGRRMALIDTNTVRVISRVAGHRITESTRRSKWIRDAYLAMLGNGDPRYFGYAMIDFASLVCRPRAPLCKRCPVLKYCRTGSRTISTDILH